MDTAGKISGEKADPRAPSSVQWFKLDAALTEFSYAMAYPCTWNKQNSRWQAITDSTKRRAVYSTVGGVVAARNDFVPCSWNNRGRIWEVLRPPTSLYRGITDAAISKGSSGVVSRYTDGTTTDSGTNDTVNNDFANVAIGKKVAYMSSGGNYYMIAAEC